MDKTLSEKIKDVSNENEWFDTKEVLEVRDVKDAVLKLKNTILKWSATRTKQSSPHRRDFWCIFTMEDIDELNKEIEKIFGKCLTEGKK